MTCTNKQFKMLDKTYMSLPFKTKTTKRRHFEIFLF